MTMEMLFYLSKVIKYVINGYFFSLILVTKPFVIHQFSCKDLLMIPKKIEKPYIYEEIFKFAS